MSDATVLPALNLTDLGSHAVVIIGAVYLHYRQMTRRLRSLSRRFAAHEKLDNQRFQELHGLIREVLSRSTRYPVPPSRPAHMARPVTGT
jgi:hypothetical protein